MFSITPWLQSTSRLTDLLKEKSGDANVIVLSESFKESGWWEKYVFSCPSELSFYREVVIKSHHHPCWFARTIIPASSFNRHKDIFSRFQKESLGDIIFSEPRIERVSLMAAPLDASFIEYHWLSSDLTENLPSTWMRRSVFAIDGRVAFYLVEIFLNGLFDAVAFS